jgi:uncharacterized protein
MLPAHISSGGRVLHGHVHGPPADRPAVLFVHGLHSTSIGHIERAEAIAERLGAVSVTFDLGGHGESEGEVGALSVADHLADVIAAYDRLVAEREVDPARVGVVGSSYGAHLAALLVARRPVARLALRAPAMYRDVDFDVPPGSRRRLASVEDASMVIGAVEAFAGPVLVVESGQDAVIPPAIVRAYHDAATDARHALMPDATHDLREPAWREEFLGHLLAFFEGM